MNVIGDGLRWISMLAAGLVILGFIYFAADEAARSSSEQIAGIGDEAVVPESEREEQNGGFREFVEDANDVLLSPFENVVVSSDPWVTQGVPALLAVLVYGLGVLTLVNYLAPSRKR